MPPVPLAISIMAHAEQIFRDTLHTVAKEHNIHNYELTIEPISTGGANYTSHLFLAKIQGSEDVNVFGKVAACGEKMREQSPMKLYESERYFYLTLSKVYKEIEEKSKLAEEDRLNIPKFYGYNGNLYEETIVLENLSSRGFTTHDRMKSFNWEYASAAVTQLAKFHALSMAYRRDNNEAFKDAVALLKVDFDRNSEQWKAVRESFVKPALDSVNEERRNMLRRFIDSNFEKNTYEEITAAKYVEVIVHGDYRPSNLMHRTREDGQIEVVPVDFQTLRGGSPIVDLLYFIYTGSDEEFRRLHYQELVDHYYNELSRAMTKLGVDPGTYSKENFDDELKEKISFGLFVGVFLLPIVTVEAENAPQVNKDMEISSFSIKKAGHLYPERFNGILNDYIRWGILT